MVRYDYTKKDIIDALIGVGLHRGDNIFNHSNLGFFGILKGAKDKNDYCTSFKNAIFDVIGTEGTLVVPTFTYSFCWNKVYDKEKTEGLCGIFSEFVRKNSSSFRSDDANFSVSALGKNAKFFTDNIPSNPFEKNSFWDRFFSRDGKICNFNFDAGSTFFHYAEKQIGVPYRYDKPFAGKSLIEGKLVTKTFYHYVRDPKNPDVYPDFTKLDKKARELGLAKVANLGRGQVVCISVKDTFNLIKKEIIKNPNFLIKGS